MHFNKIRVVGDQGRRHKLWLQPTPFQSKLYIIICVLRIRMYYVMFLLRFCLIF